MKKTKDQPKLISELKTPLRRENVMKIHFLNVGHGDMTLIDFDGVYTLVDCKISSKDDKAFKYIDSIIPSPGNGKKKKLEYVVVTHPDADHIKGLDIINDNYEIGQIWESGFRRSEDAEESPEYDAFLEIIGKVSTKQLTAGSSKLSFPVEGIDAYCFCSKSNDDDDVHYNSLVLKFVSGEKSVIFAGDSNCEAWKNKVVKNYASLLDAGILHASHHGSRSFFFETDDQDRDEPYIEGIEAVSPDYTIISGCDPDDKVKDDYPPHDDAVKLYEDYTDKSGGVFITGKDGNLVLEITGDKVELNEKASYNYKFTKGRYQKYNKLKAPFIGGLSKPSGNLTNKSFG